MRGIQNTLLSPIYLGLVLVLTGSMTSWGQAPSSTTPVPRLVRFSGTIKDAAGKPVGGVAGVTFALYKDQEGGAPLWLETQNVQLDANGRYSVMLGSTKSDGIPTELFTSGEARWLGVQPERQAEQPRVLLLSVPYALKAADAETLGGKPASAYALLPTPGNQSSTTAPSSGSQPAVGAPIVHGNGTKSFLPLWSGASLLGTSAVSQSGTNVGIGTSTPATTLDVNGAATIRGNQAVTGNISATGLISGGTGSFSASTPLFTNALSVTQKGGGSAISGFQAATSGITFGVLGSTSSTSGVGVSGQGGTGVLGIGSSVGGMFRASSSIGQILIGQNSAGKNVFNVDSNGTVSAGNVSLTGGVFAAGGLFANSGLTITGNSQSAFLGDPGCGAGFAGIGFGALSGCNNYSMIGDGKNTFVNRPLGGSLLFRENNGDELTIAPGGNVGVGTTTPQAKLEVAGNVQVDGAVVLSNGSQLGHLFSARQDSVVAINKSGVQVVALSVPSGSYAISAQTDISNLDNSEQLARCALNVGVGSNIGLAGSASVLAGSSVSLQAATTFSAPTTITLTCYTFNGYTQLSSLQALTVPLIN